jgi:hypothetical protein
MNQIVSMLPREETEYFRFLPAIKEEHLKRKIEDKIKETQKGGSA